MERTINSTPAFSALLRVLPIALLIFSFVFVAEGASAQAFGLTVRKFAASPPDQSDALRQTVRKIYTSEIGVREKGTNAGSEVESYLRYVHLPKGNPWCAAFVCWVYGQAGVANPRSGWSPGLFGERYVIWGGAESGKLKAESRGARNLEFYAYAPSRATGNRQLATPACGDIFGLYFPEKRRVAHVGFIDEWNDPWLTTVEGNTNILGSREGDGVYRKRRLVRSVYKVARYVW